MANPFDIPNPGLDPALWANIERSANREHLAPTLDAGTSLLGQALAQMWDQADLEGRWVMSAAFAHARLTTSSFRDSWNRIVPNIPVIGPFFEGGTAVVDVFTEGDNNISIGSDSSSDADSNINAGIASLVDTGERTIDIVGSDITDLVGLLLGNTEQTISQQTSNAIGLVAQEGAVSINAFEGFASDILGVIGGDVGSAIDKVTDLFGFTNNTINDLVRGSADLNEALTRSAIEAIVNTSEGSSSIIAASLADIGESIVPLISEAARENLETSNLIQTALEEQIEQSQENADVANTNLRDAIDAVVTASDSSLAVTREALVGTGVEQALATEEGAGQVSGAVETGFSGLTDTIGDFVSNTIKGTDQETLDAVRDNLARVAERTGCPADFNVVIQSFITEIFGTFSVVGGFTQAQMLVAIGNALMTPVLDVLSNCIAQAAARQVPTSLPDFSVLQDQRNRRLIGEQEAVNDLLSQGWSLDKAGTLLDQRRALPDIGILQAWWLRGFTDTERTTEMLLDLGFDAEAIENIFRMSFFIPPVGDLITMAVREVFSPEIAEAFGQFEDFPPEFADNARLQGVSEDWARNYWAAHWALPSAQQGFEMFHRKVIDQGELNVLLRALDVMPFWRDKMTAIAFRPIPRVDIRRLHAFGVLTTEDLPARYEAFGFAPPDAQLMADFTVAFNARTGGDDAQELSGITRAMAISFFKRGTLTREQTVTVLQEQGLTDDAIEILITDAEMQREGEEREEQTKLVIDQAKAGAITFNDAQDQLSGLGLEPTELARALTTLERARAATTRLPSRADGDRFLKANIITSSQYVDLLERIGYSTVWANRYLEAATAG